MTSPNTLQRMARAIYAAEFRAVWKAEPSDEGWSWTYAENYIATARAVLEVLKTLDDSTVEAMDTALANWRKSLDRDEAMARSYRAHDRKFIASATPAEKHRIRFTAAITEIQNQGAEG